MRSVAPARRAAEAAARYSLQGAVPLCTALESDAVVPGMEMLIPPWASMVGSGWLGSPWLRMQLAHWTSEPPALPFDAALLEVEVVAVREREVVAVPVLATLDVVEMVVLLDVRHRRAGTTAAAPCDQDPARERCGGQQARSWRPEQPLRVDVVVQSGLLVTARLRGVCAPVLRDGRLQEGFAPQSRTT